jgi:hypothetical protein
MLLTIDLWFSGKELWNTAQRHASANRMETSIVRELRHCGKHSKRRVGSQSASEHRFVVAVRGLGDLPNKSGYHDLSMSMGLVESKFANT